MVDVVLHFKNIPKTDHSIDFDSWTKKNLAELLKWMQYNETVLFDRLLFEYYEWLRGD